MGMKILWVSNSRVAVVMVRVSFPGSWGKCGSQSW